MVTRSLPPELTAEEWRELGLDPDDPFRYGWRYRVHERDDGSTDYERVPLTLEDVLHPQEEDFVVQGEEHIAWCLYLYAALRRLLRPNPLAVVFGDMLFHWDVPGMKGHSPDIAVVFGVRAGKRSSFDVASEGARPALVIEVTSPTTANLDHRSKIEEYHLAGVPFYVIIDRRFARGAWTTQLLGYRAAPLGYEPIAPDARGRLWLEPVRAWLGLTEGRPMLYTEAGDPIGDYEEIAAERDRFAVERDDAIARAEAEAAARLAAEQSAEAAERRVRELEAALRQLQEGE
jgi:Uma2 family endonuclease